MSQTEVIFTVVFSLYGGLLVMLGWFIKDKMRRYDKHLEECATKGKQDGALEQRLCNLEEHSSEQTQTLVWVGDSLITLGAKLQVELPKRPGR